MVDFTVFNCILKMRKIYLVTLKVPGGSAPNSLTEARGSALDWGASRPHTPAAQGPCEAVTGGPEQVQQGAPSM